MQGSIKVTVPGDVSCICTSFESTRLTPVNQGSKDAPAFKAHSWNVTPASRRKARGTRPDLGCQGQERGDRRELRQRRRAGRRPHQKARNQLPDSNSVLRWNVIPGTPAASVPSLAWKRRSHIKLLLTGAPTPTPPTHTHERHSLSSGCKRALTLFITAGSFRLHSVLLQFCDSGSIGARPRPSSASRGDTSTSAFLPLRLPFSLLWRFYKVTEATAWDRKQP